MRIVAVLRICAVWGAILGVLVPQLAFAADSSVPQARPQEAMVDVALFDGGVLVGQVMDCQGAVLPGCDIALAQNGQVLAQGKADEAGRFAFSGLNGGVYQLATAQGSTIFRVWTKEAAPPAAQQAALVVNGDGVQRAQLNGAIVNLLSNPWVLAGLVTTAIVVPLVLDDDKSPTS